MKLLQNGFQLLRNGQSQVCGVFQQGHALIRQIEENDGGTHHRAVADDTGVENMPDADQGEDEHLFENALETDFAGQLLIHHSAHDAGDVVDDYESQKRIKQAVTSSQEPSQPAADTGEHHLNGRPEFFHVVCPP